MTTEKQKKRFRITDEAPFEALRIIVSILIALVVTFIVLCVVIEGDSLPQRIGNAWTTFIALMTYPCKNLFYFGYVLVKMVPLTFAGLAKPRTGTITPKNAFIIGLAQALAVLPGLSRSGTTISTGLLLGVQRSEVSKFSFLMVLVPIIGMNLLELIGAPTGGEGIGTWQLVGGFAAAYLTGTLACRWMIRIVNRGKLTWFAVYCAAVGLLSIGFGIFH